jgi:hypothetical protein
MNRPLLVKHLASAKRHVEEGQVLVRSQQDRIYDLGKAGHDTRWPSWFWHGCKHPKQCASQIARGSKTFLQISARDGYWIERKGPPKRAKTTADASPEAMKMGSSQLEKGPDS